jgi:hypothetical protein
LYRLEKAATVGFIESGAVTQSGAFSCVATANIVKTEAIFYNDRKTRRLPEWDSSKDCWALA